MPWTHTSETLMRMLERLSFASRVIKLQECQCPQDAHEQLSHIPERLWPNISLETAFCIEKKLNKLPRSYWDLVSILISNNRCILIIGISEFSEEDLRCNFCGKTFATSGSKTRHILTVHQTADPHQCTICLRFYENKNSMTAHMATHRKQ